MKPSLAFDQNRDAIRAVIARYTVRTRACLDRLQRGLIMMAAILICWSMRYPAQR